MLLLGGRPILDYVISSLQKCGITRATMVIGENGRQIQSYFQDGQDFGMSIDYATQPEPRGTADALRLAIPHVAKGATVWVVPGHMYVSEGTFAKMKGVGGPLVLAALAVNPHPQGILEVQGTKLQNIRRLDPTPGATRVSTGAMRLPPNAVSVIAKSIEPDLDKAIAAFAQSERVDVVDAKGPVDPVIDAWGLLAVNERILDRLPRSRANGLASGPRKIGGSTTISPTAQIIGPVVIGEGCTIGDRAIVGPYVSIRNNSIIAANCEVHHSIINNNVVVDSRSVVRNSIIDDGAHLGVGFLVEEPPSEGLARGCIIGSDAEIGGAVLARAGAVLEPNKKIAHRATIGAN